MTTSSSPKLAPTVWDALVAASVVALAVLTAALFYGGRQDGARLTVVVRVGGEVVQRVPLQEFPDAPVTFQNNGYTLSVALAADDLTGGSGFGVYVAESDCPGHDCMHTGVITRAGQSIVCLPAQIVIALEGTPESGAPDLVVG